MRNRYQKPAPNPAFFQLYLADARPTLGQRLAEPEATETRRVEAVAALLAFARKALSNADEWAAMTLGGWQPERGTRLGAIPLQLRSFLTIAGLRILTAEDPVAALQCFLGRKPQGRRGRPAEDHAHRDMMITIDVAELHASGMTLAAAYKEVNKRPGTPSVKRIEDIYLDRRDDVAVRAGLEMRRWLTTAGNANDPPPEIEEQKITREQFKEYSELAGVTCRNGMTGDDNVELREFVRRASFPQKSAN
jgi:hypothetical protein